MTLSYRYNKEELLCEFAALVHSPVLSLSPKSQVSQWIPLWRKGCYLRFTVCWKHVLGRLSLLADLWIHCCSFLSPSFCLFCKIFLCVGPSLQFWGTVLAVVLLCCHRVDQGTPDYSSFCWCSVNELICLFAYFKAAVIWLSVKGQSPGLAGCEAEQNFFLVLLWPEFGNLQRTGCCSRFVSTLRFSLRNISALQPALSMYLIIRKTCIWCLHSVK